MDSVHSMQELNTNRRDCLCMYVRTYVRMYVYICMYICVCVCARARMCWWMDGWMCVGVYLFKTIYMFRQENLVC
jgi:hypothetical protein